MIIPKYSTHLTLCAGDRGTFTLSDGHLLLRCRADTIELPTERQNFTMLGEGPLLGQNCQVPISHYSHYSKQAL